MNVARVLKIVPSGLPHEYLGFHKLSLDGMLLTIELISKVVAEENEANNAAASGKSSSGANNRIAKFKANK